MTTVLVCIAILFWIALRSDCQRAYARPVPPLPPAEWNDRARLLLARSCVGEAGWGAHRGECSALAHVYLRRWRMAKARYPDLTFARVVEAYSAPLSAPEPNRRQRWVRGLPQTLTGSLARYLPAWDRIVAAVALWGAGLSPDPCPGAVHFGGAMDLWRVPPHWRPVRCSIPVLNHFWSY